MRGVASLHESTLRQADPSPACPFPSPSAVKRAALAQGKLTFRWRRGVLRGGLRFYSLWISWSLEYQGKTLVILLYSWLCVLSSPQWQPKLRPTACIRATLSNFSLPPWSGRISSMGGEPSGPREGPRGDTSLRVTERLVPLTAGEENKQGKNCVRADS